MTHLVFSSQNQQPYFQYTALSPACSPMRDRKVLVHVVSRRAQRLRPRRVPLRLAILSPVADVAFPLCEQGRHAVRQFSGLIPPARRCLYLRFTARLAAYCVRLKVRIESLLLSCRALSSPTTCRFIPAHSHPCVAVPSAQVKLV